MDKVINLPINKETETRLKAREISKRLNILEAKLRKMLLEIDHTIHKHNPQRNNNVCKPR